MRKTPFLYILVLIAFLANIFGPLPSLAQADEFRLPAPGVRVDLSPEFNPPILKGIKVHPDNPFRFDFILDQGDTPSLVKEGDRGSLKQEATRLIKYFLASLTIPEKDLWVNLSPYEKDRIIPQSFGLTEMGRDLLAEDYMLKQITASLIYPEGETGKKFWKRIYEEAARKFGTTNIPVNTFNKVWIVPEKAVVYENAKAGTAYVVESKLKVMLEQDYLALEKNTVIQKNTVILSEAKDLNKINSIRDSSATPQNDVNALGSQIIREIVIPELTKEVNENKNFAQLRQVYNSLILATWYKKKIKDSILAQVYADKNKTVGVQYISTVIPGSSTVIPAKAGIQINDVEAIYQRYLQAFKKGVYNYIKEEPDLMTQETIPRKYFSGGFDATGFAQLVLQTTSAVDFALTSQNLQEVRADFAMANGGGKELKDQAMNVPVPWEKDLKKMPSYAGNDVLYDSWWSVFESFLKRNNISVEGFKGKVLYAAYGKSTVDLEWMSRIFPEAQIVAVDWNPKAYEFQKSRPLPDNVSVRLAEIRNLEKVYVGDDLDHLDDPNYWQKIENNSYDLVIAAGFMELLDRPYLESAFGEIFRVLKPGGKFVPISHLKEDEDKIDSKGFVNLSKPDSDVKIYQKPDQAMTAWSKKKIAAVMIAGMIAAIGVGYVGTGLIENNQAVHSEIQARILPGVNNSTIELQKRIAQLQKVQDLGSKDLGFWMGLFKDYPPAPVSIVVTPGIIKEAYKVGQLDNLFNALRENENPKLLYQYSSEIPEDQMPEFSRYFATLKPGTRQQVLTILYGGMRDDYIVLEKTKSWSIMSGLFFTDYNKLRNQAEHERVLFRWLKTMLNRIKSTREENPEGPLVLNGLPDGAVAPPSIVAVNIEQSINGMHDAVVSVIKTYRNKGIEVLFLSPGNVNVSKIAELMKKGALGPEQLKSLPPYLQRHEDQIKKLSEWVEETTNPSKNSGAHRITQEELLTEAMKLHYNEKTNSVDLFGAIITIIQYLGSEGKKDNFVWDRFDHGWLMGLLPGKGKVVDDRGNPVIAWLDVDNNGNATKPPERPKTGVNRYSSTHNDFYLPWVDFLISFYTTVENQGKKNNDKIKRDFEEAHKDEPKVQLPGFFNLWQDTLSRIYRDKPFGPDGVIIVPKLYEEFQYWQFLGMEERSFWGKMMIPGQGGEGTYQKTWTVGATLGRMLAEERETSKNPGWKFVPESVSESKPGDRAMLVNSEQGAVNISIEGELEHHEELANRIGKVVNYVIENNKVPEGEGVSWSDRSIIIPLFQEEQFTVNGKTFKFIRLKGTTNNGQKPVARAYTPSESAIVKQPTDYLEIQRQNGQEVITYPRTKSKPRGAMLLDFAKREYRLMTSIFKADVPTALTIGYGEFTGMIFNGEKIGFLILAEEQDPSLPRVGMKFRYRLRERSMGSYYDDLGKDVFADVKLLRMLHQAGFTHSNPHLDQFGSDGKIYDFESSHNVQDGMSRAEFIYRVLTDFFSFYYSVDNIFSLKANYMDDTLRKENAKNILINILEGYFTQEEQKNLNLEFIDPEYLLGIISQEVKNVTSGIVLADEIEKFKEQSPVLAELVRAAGVIYDGKQVKNMGSANLATEPNPDDRAMKTNTGGINLTPANMNLQTKMDSRFRGNDSERGGNDNTLGNEGGIKFHLDPAMLAQLQNASGFVPVIISVKPLGDLQGFLGIVNQTQ